MFWVFKDKNVKNNVGMIQLRKTSIFMRNPDSLQRALGKYKYKRTGLSSKSSHSTESQHMNKAS